MHRFSIWLHCIYLHVYFDKGRLGVFFVIFSGAGFLFSCHKDSIDKLIAIRPSLIEEVVA